MDRRRVPRRTRRESVADLLGCRASEIVFTSAARRRQLRHLRTSQAWRPYHHLDHRASRRDDACKHLEAKGCEVTSIPVDGRASSIQTTSSEPSVPRPSSSHHDRQQRDRRRAARREIARSPPKPTCTSHRRCQAVGKIPIDVNKIACTS